MGGGWGHLTRATALARAAGPKRSVRILTNSPYAPEVCGRLPEAEVIAIDPESSATVVRENVMRHVASFDPKRFFVYTFPRGLGGELDGVLQTVAAKKILVHRDLNPLYVARMNLREFVVANYDVVIAAGEGAAFPRSRTTAPWLIRRPDEVPSAEDARKMLRVEKDKCVLVQAGGNADELAGMEKWGSCSMPHFPMLIYVAWACTALPDVRSPPGSVTGRHGPVARRKRRSRRSRI